MDIDFQAGECYYKKRIFEKDNASVGAKGSGVRRSRISGGKFGEKTVKFEDEVMHANMQEVQICMEFGNMYFDRVRLIDTENCRQIRIDREGKSVDDGPCRYGMDAESCEHVQNCYANRKTCRFEWIHDRIFRVMTVSIVMQRENGEDGRFCLELLEEKTDFSVYKTLTDGMKLEEMEAEADRAYFDSMTGVYSRRVFDERVFVPEFLNERITFVVADLRKFKRINDEHGHEAGDRILRRVAETIKSSLRKTDLIIRIGGDEFLLALKNCPHYWAEKKMHVISAKLMAKSKLEDGHGILARVDFGIAEDHCFDGTEESIHRLFNEADRNMYEMKRGKK